MTKSINIIDKLLGVFEKEKPIFETLLDIETRIFKKIFSLLKKTKRVKIIISK